MAFQISFLLCLCRKSDLDGKGRHMLWFSWNNPGLQGHPGQFSICLRMFLLKNKQTRLYFSGQFYVHNKTEWKVQRLQLYPLPLHMHSLLHYRQPPQSGTFVVFIIWLAHPDHSKSIACMRVHSWCCKFCGFGQKYMTCIYYYRIIQNGFVALKVLCALTIHLTLPPTPGDH